MGIVTKAYLETLISHKIGFPVELKSLTGAALEAFNKLHPRGAEGTRIGGRFVKKVEGMVGEVVESAVKDMGNKSKPFLGKHSPSPREIAAQKKKMEVIMGENKYGNSSHKTAIARKVLSAPMQLLKKRNLLKGKMLDYGAGRGFDANFLKMEKYDPHYFPNKGILKDRHYDTITVNYVLNTISPQEGDKIIENLRRYLKEEGKAYIAVRRDIAKVGLTSKGTYQHNVELDLPLEYGNKSFAIYRMDGPFVETHGVWTPKKRKAVTEMNLFNDEEKRIEKLVNYEDVRSDDLVVHIQRGLSKPEHIKTIRVTIEDTYRRARLSKLNKIIIEATDTEFYKQFDSSRINMYSRKLTICPTFPFNSVKEKIDYFYKKAEYIAKAIKHQRDMLPAASQIGPDRVQVAENEIKRLTAILNGHRKNIKILKGEIDELITEHSTFNIPNPRIATIYHELGHQWHYDYKTLINYHFGIKKLKGHGVVSSNINFTRPIEEKEEELLKIYGVTDRAKDNWDECMAENFALYMAGKAKFLHEDMRKFFSKYIVNKQEVKRIATKEKRHQVYVAQKDKK